MKVISGSRWETQGPSIALGMAGVLCSACGLGYDVKQR